MTKTITAKTTEELAYLDGQYLFDDLVVYLLSAMGRECTMKIDISSEAIQGYTKVIRVGSIGNTHQFQTKHGLFSVCKKAATQYGLGKQFFYKINK